MYNLSTYPNLIGFFEELGVETEPSDMSFALSMDDGKLEWGSDNLSSIFAQRKNLASPTFLHMLYDVVSALIFKGYSSLLSSFLCPVSSKSPEMRFYFLPLTKCQHATTQQVRFGREAPKVLEPANQKAYANVSLGEYIKQHGYSDAFTYNYCLPMCAAIWSVPNAQVRWLIN